MTNPPPSDEDIIALSLGLAERLSEKGCARCEALAAQVESLRRELSRTDLLGRAAVQDQKDYLHYVLDDTADQDGGIPDDIS